jgi:hypothetical protein
MLAICSVQRQLPTMWALTACATGAHCLGESVRVVEQLCNAWEIGTTAVRWWCAAIAPWGLEVLGEPLAVIPLRGNPSIGDQPPLPHDKGMALICVSRYASWWAARVRHGIYAANGSCGCSEGHPNTRNTRQMPIGECGEEQRGPPSRLCALTMCPLHSQYSRMLRTARGLQGSNIGRSRTL